MIDSAHRKLHLLIDGKHIGPQGRDTRPVVNPATGEVIGNLPIATDNDLAEALGAAERGFRLWRNVATDKRAQLMHRAAKLLRERSQHIAPLLTIENGKPLVEAQWEIGYAADVLDWYAAEAMRVHGRILPKREMMARAMVIKQPIGPVAGFAPWNVPIVLSGNKIAAAIAAGCSIVVKPAEETPASVLEYAQALVDAGLPHGVVNVVFGVPSHISETLIASKIIRKVAFTGSTAVGRQIAALSAAGLKRVSLELGGHAPAIVFDDANLEHAVNTLAAFKYFNAGQVCFSPTRFYVQERVYDSFIREFVDRAKAIRVGTGLQLESQMGPLANVRRKEAVERLFNQAISRGAKVETGGPGLESEPGNWWMPTVLSGVSAEALAMREEPFGPLALVSRFKQLDEVIEQANATPYGLAAFGFTSSARTRYELIERLECGLCGINTCDVARPDMPFGGVKDSGYGYDYGAEGLDAYYVQKSINEIIV